MIMIRKEETGDTAAVRKVNVAAFGQNEEADIIDSLRAGCSDLLSLVALADDQVVAHILFSPVHVDVGELSVQGMGLGPMAVLPGFQRRGIGSELVETGITALKERGCPYVVVLGHPEYYPRFGFEPASRHGIRSEWDVPDEVFMVLILEKSKMAGVSGLVRYRKEFSRNL